MNWTLMDPGGDPSDGMTKHSVIAFGMLFGGTWIVIIGFMYIDAYYLKWPEWTEMLGFPLGILWMGFCSVLRRLFIKR